MNNERSYQRMQDLVYALKEWFRTGEKGTRPRKVRVNSSLAKRAKHNARIKRDRKKRSETKKIQLVRVSRNQHIRTGA